MSLTEGGANRRGCSCSLVFIKKRVLIEGGMHVGSFLSEKECKEKVVHGDKLFFKR